MRIISQDGMVNVPYDAIIVQVEEFATGEYTIKAITFFGRGYMLGDYSSKEQCLHVMDDIAEKLATGYKVFKMPDDTHK